MGSILKTGKKKLVFGLVVLKCENFNCQGWVFLNIDPNIFRSLFTHIITTEAAKAQFSFWTFTTPCYPRYNTTWNPIQCLPTARITFPARFDPLGLFFAFSNVLFYPSLPQQNMFHFCKKKFPTLFAWFPQVVSQVFCLPVDYRKDVLPPSEEHAF